METILILLPVLVCPIVMGGLMWMMSRGDKDQAPSDSPRVNRTTSVPGVEPPKPARRGGVLRMLSMCLNWKVLAGLGAVGLGVLVVAPNLAPVALPVLLALACPISMLFMLRGMRGTQGDRCDQCASQTEQLSQSVILDPSRVAAPAERLPTRETMPAVEPRHD